MTKEKEHVPHNHPQTWKSNRHWILNEPKHTVCIMHLPHLQQTWDGKPEKLWWDQNDCISRRTRNTSTAAGEKSKILTKLGLQYFSYPLVNCFQVAYKESGESQVKEWYRRNASPHYVWKTLINSDNFGWLFVCVCWFVCFRTHTPFHLDSLPPLRSICDGPHWKGKLTAMFNFPAITENWTLQEDCGARELFITCTIML